MSKSSSPPALWEIKKNCLMDDHFPTVTCDSTQNPHKDRVVCKSLQWIINIEMLLITEN
jgi:hypothetical protein